MTTNKLPSGSWRCRVRYGGKQKSFTGATKKEAEFLAYKFLAENPDGLPMYHSTVGAILDAHINAREGALSPSTVIAYRKIRRLYFLDLAEKKADELTANDVQASVSTLARTVSPKTVRNAYGLLHAALENYVKPSVFAKIVLPQKEKKKYYVPPTSDVEAVLQHFKGTVYELPLSLAAFCGLRRGEICALTVGDFDKKKKTVSITKAVTKIPGGGTAIKKPKTTESERSVFCPDRVLALVPNGRPDDPIYSGGLDVLYNKLQEAVTALRIHPFRLHDLRHFYCSSLIRFGVPMFYISDAMGHADDKMIKAIYGHVMEEGHREFDEIINDGFRV